MKIEPKTVLLIIFISSLLGFTYNYFSPTGIPIFPERKILKQASDSLFYSSPQDSNKTNNIDSVKQNETQKKGKIKEGPPQTALKNDKEKTSAKDEVKKEEKEKVQTEPLSINLKQAYILYKKNVLFIDAREPEDYKAAHIKNAINIPMDHFQDYEYMLKNIDKNQPIVTYCAGSECDLSIVLGNVLFDKGYKKLYVFFGGWVEWQKAKYPIESSENKNEKSTNK
jgi:rhodanese-related sulfurtransferase